MFVCVSISISGSESASSVRACVRYVCEICVYD